VIRVTAAILRREGLVLLARRPPGDRLAGKWEFPGGKLEAGETPPQCLARELAEELGVAVHIGAFVASTVHRYPHATIELLAYEVRLADEREPSARAHDALAWVAPADLLAWDLAEADIPLARALVHADG
jgi:8-oxo-dGTP diphosphatase